MNTSRLATGVLVVAAVLQLATAFLLPCLPRCARPGLSRAPSTLVRNVPAPLISPGYALEYSGRGVSRHSTTRLYGIFGLGTPELIVIAVVAGIVLGPDKIVDLARGVGKAAGELKAVPQEFEKGMKSGEESARKAVTAKKKEGVAMERSPKPEEVDA